MRKVVWKWLATGWVIATRVRLDNGQMDVIYDVYDEPGPGLSDEEIRACSQPRARRPAAQPVPNRMREIGCGSPGAETRTQHSIISTEEENTEGPTPSSTASGESAWRREGGGLLSGFGSGSRSVDRHPRRACLIARGDRRDAGG
jgi:hypothetical protein